MDANHIFKEHFPFFFQVKQSSLNFDAGTVHITANFTIFKQLNELPSNIFFNTAQPRRRRHPLPRTLPPPAT